MATLHQLFARQVRQNPTKTAIWYNGQALDFQQLNQQAEWLSGTIQTHLQTQCSQPHTQDRPIALFCERHPQMVVAILAVLKAGAAYVPIAIEEPKRRVEHILKDTSAALVLTQSNRLEKLVDFAGEVICLDGDVQNDEPPNNLSDNAVEHDLAYIIYTSGTTGKPKGVMIEHQNVVSLIEAQTRAFDFSADEVVVWLASTAFDASVEQLFLPLLNGATLYIPTEHERRDAKLLKQKVIEHGVTHLHATPAFLAALGAFEKEHRLKRVISGGDRVPAELKARWGQLLINEYGPTETTVTAIQSLDFAAQSHINCIGQPLEHAQIHVLSADLEPVPHGEVGVLYIGGAGVARGYLNQPKLTAECFIAVSLTNGRVARLYNTGDLVRYNQNGQLIFEGRIDNQVKIRGFRIEPQEVQQVLSGFSGIKQSVVIDFTQAGSRYLAAYFVAQSDIDVELTAVKNHLELHLPEYMIPVSITALDTIPLTNNGKLDKAALPAPQLVVQADYIAPKAKLEQQLCEIWQSVLGLEQVGIDDNFFSIGGHSINAIRLCAAISQNLDCHVNLAMLLNHPSIRTLAEQLQERSSIDGHHVIESYGLARYPVSFAQQRLLFIESMTQGSSAYHIPYLFKVQTQQLDVLLQAFQWVIARHDGFNTRYQQDTDGSYHAHLVNDKAVFDSPIHEPGELAATVQQYIDLPFDLSGEAPVRLRHYQCGEDHYIQLVFHHIAFDLWSAGIFFDELAQAYHSFKDNIEPRLPELDIAYGDYAKWQRHYLTGQSYTQLLDYWRAELSGYETLDLPIDYQRPARFIHDGRDLRFNLDVHLSAQLKALAKEEKVSLNTLLLGGFYLCLRYITGQDDLVIGMPADNRTEQQTQSVVGFFVNSLALRLHINAEQSLKNLLSKLHKTVTGGLSHQQLPFDKLVEALDIERDPSRHPLFQVMFTFTQAQNTDLPLPLEMVESEGDAAPAKFDLSLFLTEQEDSISGHLNYATALFKVETAERICQTYQQILQLMVRAEQPHVPLFEMSLHSSEPTAAQPFWHDNDEAFDLTCLHRAFEYQAAAMPDSIALSYVGRQVTYSELNRRANQLARFIRMRYHQVCGDNMPPDTLVALYFDRSPEMLIAMLAVLKAGGAYVPISPAYPKQRTCYILEDTSARLLLTQSHYVDSLGQWLAGVEHKPALLAVDKQDWHQVDNTDNLPAYSQLNHLAYVIYTSGTTGQPKGVLLEHRSVANYIHAVTPYFAPDCKNVDFSTNYCFDLTVTTTLCPLILGRTVCIYDGELTDSEAYGRHLTGRQIDFVKTTPTLAQVLLSQTPRKIHTVFLGGEALSAHVVEQLSDRVQYLYDEYGPTEATVGTTIVQVHPQTVESTFKIYPNYKIYLLSPQKQPVPTGAVGELYIGGAGLARGYLNRPELTAERFIENPFLTDAAPATSALERRIYQTGDLVRLSSEGHITYLGRNDAQVKIRGYRVELGEIQSALSQLPQVKQAAVIDVQKQGKVFLAAYIVCFDKKYNAIDDIKTALLELLPDYMVPSHFVFVDSIPTTTNGKLDRQALPAFDLTEQDNYVAPSTELQMQLCEIWQSLLNVSRVGLLDNFFRIGGDSIVSIKLVSILRAQGLTLQVKHIFEAPTVVQLAKLIESLCDDQKQLDAEQGLLQGQFDLLPVQQWFFAEKLKAAHHYNQAFKVVIPANTQTQEIETVVAALVARHDMLRCCFELTDKGYQQNYQTHSTGSALKTVDVSNLTDNAQHDLLTGFQNAFDFHQGPLWQVVRLKTGTEKDRLWFAFHHLVIDAVSWRIIAQDIQTLLTGGQPGSKTSSYRQWVKTVEQYADKHRDEVSYWQQVTENQAVLPSPQVPLYHQVKLSPKATGILLHQANQGYHTEINDLLLAALAIALKPVFGVNTNPICLEGHGRENLDVMETERSFIDVSQTVGWFTTMFPVALTSFDSIEQTIIHTKEMLAAIPVKGLGYGALVSAGVLEDKLPPLCFNYLGQLDSNGGQTADSDSSAMWQLETQYCGNQVDNQNEHGYLLNIIGSVQQGQLQFGISSGLDVEKAQAFAEYFEQALLSVIEQAHQRVIQGSIKTPSDFVVPVDFEHLQSLQASLSKQNSIEAIYPATSLQQGFIYHYLSQPNDDAYRVQVLWDYHLSLDISVFKKAWLLTAKNFAALRMGFDWQQQILQVISTESAIDAGAFEVVDLSHLSVTAREKAINNITLSEREKPFDLSKPGLLRFTIIKQSEALYTVIRTEHHAISDGWSGPLMLKAVHHYYNQLKLGKTPHIEVDSAYHDAQRYLMAQQQATEDYWAARKAQFSEANDINLMLDHPIDLSKPLNINQADDSLLVLPTQDYVRLKNTCAANGVTLNVAVQFAWHQLIKMYSGDRQTIVGTVVSGRDIPVEGIASSVGLYINTLPLKIDWAEHENCLSVMSDLQQEIAELNSHSNVSLANLQSGRGRLFHTLLVFENYPKEAQNNSGGIESSAFFRHSVEKVDYPLCLSAYEQNETLHIKLAYCREMLGEVKAKRLLQQLSCVLAAITKDPKQACSDLVVSDAAEQKQLLYGFNQNHSDYPTATLHHLFEQQVKTQGQSIALVVGNERLSYESLNQKANRLARYLRETYLEQNGCELLPDTAIALYFERNVDMVVAILAVLKAGGAYVPILPEQPKSRTLYMLQDTQSPMILCRQSDSTQLKDWCEELDGNVAVLPVDGDELLAAQSNDNLPLGAEPHDLAYLIYTSGTTGQPKGVMVEHQAAVSFCVNNRYVDSNTVARVASLSSYGFDGFIFDLFFSLLNGAAVYLYDNEVIVDPKRLSEALAQDSIDTFFVTTALFNQLIVSNMLPGTAVRNILFGGENCDNNILARALAEIDGLSLVHCYGPTEAVVYASCYLFERDHFVRGSHLAPIGSALNNKCLLVLDENLKPVPVGVPGELYVGGAGLARGYLNARQMTDSRFVENPYAGDVQKDQGQHLMYKTGDIVRWLPDGDLVYMSRIDTLVKVRGFRVELEEINGALTALEQVKQAAVVAHKKANIGYLVAYVVAQNAPLDSFAIKSKLSEKLPDYMVPGNIVVLDELPLNSSGKVDHKRLPKPDITQDNYVPPETELESTLVEIWQQVLMLPQVGIEDHFFHIGGNSLSAIRLIALVREQLDVDLPLALLFEHPTIKGLAGNMAGLGKQSIEAKNQQQYPLSFAQKRLLFIESLEQGSGAYHVPYLVEMLDDDLSLMQQAMNVLVERHRVLTGVYRQNDEQEYYQRFGEQSVGIHSQSVNDEQALLCCAMAHINKPFDLSRDGALKLYHYALHDKNYLLILFHHIAFDGWSWDVFARELSAIHHSLKFAKPLDLPEPDITYGDFALWQNQQLAGEKRDTLLDYWRGHLSGFDNLQLPCDNPRPTTPDYRGADIEFVLDAHLSQQLLDSARACHTTLYTLLLSGFYLTLNTLSGQSDVVVGTPSDNRHHGQIQSLIGFFVNTLALRANVDSRLTLAEFVEQVHQVVTGAKAHQELPFEVLVDALNIERDISRHPIYQVMFSLQQDDGQRQSNDRLPFELVSLEQFGAQNDWYCPAKFDLTLFLNQRDGQIHGCFNYATSLFDQTTIERFKGMYLQVLNALVDESRLVKPIAEIERMSEQEQSALLYDWNNTVETFPNLTLHQLFEQQVEQTPDKVALVFDGEQISYQGLNARANQLAHGIRDNFFKHTGKPLAVDTPIALYIDRGINMVVTILAVLKAGGAYVPIATDFPKARIGFMLRDTQTPLILTDSNNQQVMQDVCAEHLDASERTAKLMLVDNDNLIKALPTDNLEVLSKPEDLSYIFYTSGTTGQPKGVMIEHQSAVNTIFAMSKIYNIKAGNDQVGCFCDYVFDISVSEIFNALGFGGCLHLFDNATRHDPERLAQYVNSHQLSLIFLPPAVLAELPQQQFEDLNTIIFCGERCDSVKCAYWAEHYQLYNLYGPTEAAIYAGGQRAQLPDLNVIGRALANVQLYVLDKDMQLCPVGVPGDLYIGGAGLARGYLNRPQLTQSVFIDSPFAIHGQTVRLYKTGDRVKWLPQGQLAFIGRDDNQVKLRGYRIELSEIENVLSRHPAVNTSVVIVDRSQQDSRLLAYVILAQGHTSADLTACLKAQLPSYMVPAEVMVLEKLPLNVNGKIDRAALPIPGNDIEDNADRQTGLEQKLAAVWQEILRKPDVGINDSFFDLGGHSLLMLRLKAKLDVMLEKPVSLVELFQYPTVRRLADFLESTPQVQTKQEKTKAPSIDGDIAIIGLAGRFPGAQNVNQFWQNLRDGVCSVKRFNDAELLSLGVDEATFSRDDYVNANGVLADVDCFDGEFFGYSPFEAQIIDPQQRVLLEVAWHAMEHAGINVSDISCPVGVFAAVGNNHYLQKHLLGNKAILARQGEYQLMLSNDKDFAATRIAYKLGLTGPAVAVQTACSSSLVAVHLACQSLSRGECEMALVGGVRIGLPQQGYLYQEGMIGSPDGVCRAFDADARGTVGGSGGAMVVLAPLTKALENHHTVYAVIKGSAINNDGTEKVGYTAPGVNGQAQVIGQALANAGIAAGSVSYVEAHGTATPMGDPVEVAALTLAYRADTDKNGFCGLGSVKTNIGHLDVAAGIAGLVKTTLALHHRQMPASLFYRQGNEQIDFASSPFYVNQSLQSWQSESPLRAGVSSFGIGGTNAHVVLEQRLEQSPEKSTTHNDHRRWQLLCLSAKTQSALEQACDHLAEHLTQHDEQRLVDAAYTLHVGRQLFEHRQFVVCDDAGRFKGSIDLRQRQRAEQTSAEVVFTFPGQGSQFGGMAAELYREEPQFKETVDYCCEYLKPLLNADITQVMFDNDAKQSEMLSKTQFAQPALFVCEYALAKLCIGWGIEPAAMIGHSIGEYVAACLAGVFSLQGALTVVAARGRLMQQMPTGEMVAVALSFDECRQYLVEGVVIAANNAPEQCVVSGDKQAVADFIDNLPISVVRKVLNTAHAFHSPMMQPVSAEFREVLSAVQLHQPKRKWLSNVTGKWVTASQATSVDYWCRHLLETVCFNDCVKTVLGQLERPVFVEFGPGRTLSAMVSRHQGAVAIAAHTSAGDDQPQQAKLLEMLGRLWLNGVEIDWQTFYGNADVKRVALPTYAFAKTRHWVEPLPPEGFVDSAIKLVVADAYRKLSSNSSGHSAQDLTAAIKTVCDQAINEVVDSALNNAIESQLDSNSSKAEVLHKSRESSLLIEKQYSETEYQVARLFQSVLGVDKMSLQDDFNTLGGSSLLAVQLMSELGKLSIKLDLVSASSLSVKAIAQTADSTEVIGQNNLIVPLKHYAKDAENVFFIHPVGGSVVLYKAITDKLNGGFNYYGIQNINIYQRQLLTADSLEALAAAYVEALLRIQPMGDYRLAGSSMGGAIAYEMACQLVKAGKKVVSVSMFDSWAVYADAFKDRARFEQNIWSQHQEYTQGLEGVESSAREKLIEASWGLMTLLTNYRPSLSSLPIYLYKANQLDVMHAGNDDCPDNGWQQHTDYPVTVYEIEGNHATIHSGQGLMQICELLNLHLASSKNKGKDSQVVN